MEKNTRKSDAFLSLKVSDNKAKPIKRRHKRNSEALAATRGLLYVGHIPHGFYEEEMEEYFSQFGRVTNVKVCRSKLSGKSKGYGFIEFTTPEVAKIASETMNNYLMFKKRVVAMYIPAVKRPPFLFNSLVSQKKLPGKLRQERQVMSKNKVLDDRGIVKKNNLKMTRLKQKLERLKKRGCEIQPINC